MEEEIREERQVRVLREDRMRRKNRFIVLGCLFFAAALLLFIFRPKSIPLGWGYDSGRWCTDAKAVVDLFDAAPMRQFRYSPHRGCFAKVVLPSFFHHWHVQTANPERAGDWVVIACVDSRIVLPPQSPNANTRFSLCGGDTPKERNTFLFQGNAELMFISFD